jgi:small subunit ribosomal protein S16
MLMIRFQRTGRTNDPSFRIACLEKERAAKAGNIVELLGTYNPRSKALTLNEERVKHWIAQGAQPTDSIRNLLINKGVIEGKKINVLPKKTPQKNEAAIAAEAAAVAEVAAAKKAADAAAVAPAPVEAAAPIAEELPTEAQVEAEALPAEVIAEEVPPEVAAEDIVA